MIKKLSLLFSLILLPLMASAYDAEIDGIFYNLDGKSRVAKVTFGNNKYKGFVTIPTSIVYKGVTCKVIEIEDYAFSGCSDLAQVSIGNSVTSIGNSAFADCYRLTDLSIGDSVKSIGEDAFISCIRLKSVKIPNSVTTIGEGTFSYCSDLTNLSIGNSVKSIGDYAFFHCTCLTSVTIPNNVSSIGSYAFAICDSLKDVTIGNGVTSIGEGAFNYCNNLTMLTIGDGIKSIEKNAFAYCGNLLDVYCWAEKVPNTISSAFDSSYIDFATLHVSASSIAAYQEVEPWKNFGTIKALSEETPEVPKCITPTISYVDGKLTFDCETEGVEYVSHIELPSSFDSNSYEVRVPTTYKVMVYATKDGYENSDIATKLINVRGTSAKKGDVNEDGQVNGTDIQEVINIIVNGDDEDEDIKLEKAGVRFGFYETIPGYSVKINKINITGLGVAEFGSDIIGSTIGTSTDTRTLDRADGNFTNVYLKDINEDTEMVVEVDFTMIADDGSAETINQKATTTVAPQGVTQWQPNRNYTFIYKILLTPLYMVEDSVPAVYLDSVVVDGQGGMTR